MTNTNTLAGRVAVVTGATSGIGAATARRLADAGASVALVGRRESRLKELAAGIGGTALPVAADVGDLDAMRAAAATVRAAFGRVDLVVANAGVMLAAPFESAETAEWDQMIGTNVTGKCGDNRGFGMIRFLVPMLVNETASGDAILTGGGGTAGMGSAVEVEGNALQGT